MLVALRKESVDRNSIPSWNTSGITVALRKESVDRHRPIGGINNPGRVALRKESVDRNDDLNVPDSVSKGRSPQGERG